MKKSFFLLMLILLSVSVVYGGDVYVRGYQKSDGTYVQPHYRTSPNSTRNDNYSTKGNINPYTGKEGTKERDTYSSPKTYDTYDTKPRKKSSAWGD
ncbi:hypothetical protein KKI24_11715 [bacterium]|nr:hypothetical protein [bacterium]